MSYLIIRRPNAAEPPSITSGSSASVDENAALSHSLTANESVTWSIVGGNDSSDFEISSSTLRWTSNGSKDYENPDDTGTNNVYNVTVRATSVSSGQTTDQAIAITVNDVSEGGGGEPSGWIDNAILNYYGPVIDSTTEAAINANFNTWVSLVSSGRKNNRVYTDTPTGSQYGYPLACIMWDLKGMDSDWTTDAYGFLDNYIATVPSALDQEQRRLAFDYEASIRNGASNSSTYTTFLSKTIDRNAEHLYQGNYMNMAHANYQGSRPFYKAMQSYLAGVRGNVTSDNASGYASVSPATQLTRLQYMRDLIINNQQSDGGFVSWGTGVSTSTRHWYHAAIIMWTAMIYYRNHEQSADLLYAVKKFMEGVWAMHWQRTAGVHSMHVFNSYDGANEMNGEPNGWRDHDAGQWVNAGVVLAPVYVTLCYMLSHYDADDTWVTRGDQLMDAFLDEEDVGNVTGVQVKNWDYAAAMGAPSWGYWRTKGAATTQASGRPKCTAVPTISHAGSNVYNVTTGTWSNSPDNYTYQWYRGQGTTAAASSGASGDGIFLISGATSNSYDASSIVAANDRLWCAVSAVKTGHTGMNAPLVATTAWTSI